MEVKAMKDAIRVVLVDPVSDTRQTLQRLLGGLDALWLAEACDSYEGASRRINEVGAELLIVVIDADPAQAVNLIQTIVQRSPNVAVLPASRARDGSRDHQDRLTVKAKRHVRGMHLVGV